MKKEKFLEYSSWLVCIIPFIAYILYYSELPNKIPNHWNIEGNVDSYVTKGITIFILPLLPFFINALMKYIPKIDPKKNNFAQFIFSFLAFRLGMCIFFTIMCLAILYSQINPETNLIALIMPTLIGLLFAMIGLAIPYFKPNYMAGIRTPWTLADETVWEKTHKISGTVWLYGGIVMALSGLLIKDYFVVVTVMISSVLILTIIPIMYSFIIFKKLHK